jgi:hypothetical protein
MADSITLFESGDLVNFKDITSSFGRVNDDLTGIVIEIREEFGITLCQIFWLDNETSLEKPHNLKLVQRRSVDG